jgi:hypothetical protein
MTKNDITLIYLQINKKIAYSSKQLLFFAVKYSLKALNLNPLYTLIITTY